MNLRAVNKIGYGGGKVAAPGSVFTIRDENEANRLVRIRAAEFIPELEQAPNAPEVDESKPNLNPEMELLKISGITPDILAGLVANKIDSIDKLLELSITKLAGLKIEGVKKTSAKKILANAREYKGE